MGKRVLKFSVLFLIVLILTALYFLFFMGRGSYPAEFLKPEYFINSDDTLKERILFSVLDLKTGMNGDIYLVDRGNNRIVRYSSDGNFLGWFGGAGQGPGELLEPLYLDIDDSGNVYVAEGRNRRISIFDRYGRFINTFKIRGYPSSIAVNSKGEIFVNEPMLNGSLLYVYTKNGELIDSIGKVEPVVMPFGISPEITQIHNSLWVRYNKAVDEIWVVYKVKPVFKRFARNGNLLCNKEITGEEIKLAQKLNYEYQKKNPPTPYHYSVLFTFNGIDLIDNDLCIVKVRGVNCFYLINKNGEVIKKYVVDIQNPLFRFCYDNRYNRIISTSSGDTIYQINLNKNKWR